MYLSIFNLIGNTDVREIPTEKTTRWEDTLYALSKTGAVRVYKIIVEDKGDHATLSTQKQIGLDGKITEDTYEYYEGVNIGKSNETTYLEQALNEAKSLYKRQLDAGFTAEIPKGKFNTDANGLMKPMLAIGFNENKIKFPCLVQPKYDGVRCRALIVNREVKLISRKGKEYNIPHIKVYLEKHRELLPLDGELYNHKELTFQEIISAVKRHSEITPKIRYVIYDRPVEGTNKERWSKLIDDFCQISLEEKPIYLSDYAFASNMDDIRKYHKRYVEQGYEGLIIRNTDGVYEFGFRSNNLIKYKVFDDAEFEIVDVVEATGRDAGTAIFVCKCDGGEFNVKPQGTREQRAIYWQNRENIIGKEVTVQYQGLSDEGIPRFPSAIAIRDYEDLPF